MAALSPSPPPQDLQKKTAADRAVDLVRDGQVVGLGTGSTVKYLLEGLARRVGEGLRIRGVPTSRETAELAAKLGLSLCGEEEEWQIDLAIDGADQVDQRYNAIKGGGGALLREKIVARAARQFIVIIDAGKRVERLGSTFPLPVEVVPFGWRTTCRHIQALGLTPTLRVRDGSAFVTDNGNYIVDVATPGISAPEELDAQLNRIPGVVENGLFTGLISTLIVGGEEGVELYQVRD